jgi:hypothetical protein
MDEGRTKGLRLMERSARPRSTVRMAALPPRECPTAKDGFVPYFSAIVT